MARRKRYRCPRPPGRLVMHRQKNLYGPFYQNNTIRCIKSTGNYLAPGMPGSGPQALFGVVLDATSIQITFTQCVSISGPVGIEYQVDGGAWTQVTAALKVDDTNWDFTVGTIAPGDDVRWRYVGGSGTILDCDDAADIGDQNIPVENPMVLAGNLILLQTSSTSVLLLEDAADLQADGVALEDRP